MDGKTVNMTPDLTKFKQEAAEKAVEFIQSGMVVGLGEGSTAIFAIRKLGQKIQEGALKDILGIPCSKKVEMEAQKAGIPLTSLNEHPAIDITIDGADEVDPQLNLIKGGGGALLREKIVAQATKREIIVVDESKLSPALGTHWPLPIEVVPFAWKSHIPYLATLGGKADQHLNADGQPCTTDQGNYILYCNFGPIKDPGALSTVLKQHAGIAEHGLFVNLATDVIVAGVDGIRHIAK
jgi:ribose 5-phosphate isomerase A